MSRGARWCAGGVPRARARSGLDAFGAEGSLLLYVLCIAFRLRAEALLDQNVGGAAFRNGENRLQLLSISGDVAGLWEASVDAGREGSAPC